MVANFWKLSQGNCLEFESSLGCRMRLYFRRPNVNKNTRWKWPLSMARNSLVCVYVLHVIILLNLLGFLLFPSGARQLPSAEQCAEALFCAHALGLRVLKVFNISDHSCKLIALDSPTKQWKKNCCWQTGDHMEKMKLDPCHSHRALKKNAGHGGHGLSTRHIEADESLWAWG